MQANLANRWWHNSVFYEIYIASFQDSNGDGIGDFVGLTRRLDYLQALGITALWITPFFPSPKIDNGYDVADYFGVDSDFGTLAEFDYFIAQAHQRNIKVIIDVVLNHVSTEHTWFQSAISEPGSKYRDYFFFQDQPNNWESFFGGPAWHQEPNGEQFYYHKFAPQQADLNWQNPAVMADMIHMLKFWLDRGVDGLRMDVINFLSCNGITKDNPYSDDGIQLHVHDIDQQGINACLAELCLAVRTYSATLGKDSFLVGEIGHDELAKLHPYQHPLLLDVVFNFNLGSIVKFDIEHVVQQLQDMENQLSGLPTLFFNSHDMPRSMSRLCQGDSAQAMALAALTLTAKGVCFLYYGEEIGMPDYQPPTVADVRDIRAKNQLQLALNQGQTAAQAFSTASVQNRDKSRLYMQWDQQNYCGFSDSKPWIGHPGMPIVTTVTMQQSDPHSLWHWYRQLISLRKATPALHQGNYEQLRLHQQLLLIVRSWQDDVIHIRINFNQLIQPINFNDAHEILASKGFDPEQPAWLPPNAVLITRVR